MQLSSSISPGAAAKQAAQNEEKSCLHLSNSHLDHVVDSLPVATDSLLSLPQLSVAQGGECCVLARKPGGRIESRFDLQVVGPGIHTLQPQRSSWVQPKPSPGVNPPPLILHPGVKPAHINPASTPTEGPQYGRF